MKITFYPCELNGAPMGTTEVVDAGDPPAIIMTGPGGLYAPQDLTFVQRRIDERLGLRRPRNR